MTSFGKSFAAGQDATKLFRKFVLVSPSTALTPQLAVMCDWNDLTSAYLHSSPPYHGLDMGRDLGNVQKMANRQMISTSFGGDADRPPPSRTLPHVAAKHQKCIANSGDRGNLWPHVAAAYRCKTE